MLLRVQFVGDHMHTLVHGQQSTVHKWHLEHYTQYACTLHIRVHELILSGSF